MIVELPFCPRLTASLGLKLPSAASLTPMSRACAAGYWRGRMAREHALAVSLYPASARSSRLAPAYGASLCASIQQGQVEALAELVGALGGELGALRFGPMRAESARVAGFRLVVEKTLSALLTDAERERATDPSLRLLLGELGAVDTALAEAAWARFDALEPSVDDETSPVAHALRATLVALRAPFVSLGVHDSNALGASVAGLGVHGRAELAELFDATLAALAPTFEARAFAPARARRRCSPSRRFGIRPPR